MRVTTALKGLGAAAVGVGAAAAVGRARFDRETAALTDELLADAEGRPERAVAGERRIVTDTDRTVTNDDLAGLPDPVGDYLDHAIRDGRSYVRTVRLEQRGEFRLGGADAPWKPLEATQRFTVRPPGFVWDATVELAPFVPIRAVDAYVGGSGSLRAAVFGSLPVANADPGPALDEGELLRYLAETVWFPTALVPGEGVEWEARDDDSALATVEHGDATASAVFHFGDDHRVERIAAERPRATDDGGYERRAWTVRLRNYRERNGLLVPTEGEVEWNLPDGDLPYWRAEITEIEYLPAE
ncbi:hypothetical protein M0R89_05830 [Halorussus limi]|uniref:Uncharacterized protein n=1 Tax=Halorussus limi TaxID=2938695 RepID=A0A8U0HYH4_9EURY|nr:DUF6544 family protein [Halorussus limi]UPV75584.1 hypothetical protein M0R89_05830 [Halorussus limi]